MRRLLLAPVLLLAVLLAACGSSPSGSSGTTSTTTTTSTTAPPATTTSTTAATGTGSTSSTSSTTTTSATTTAPAVADPTDRTVEPVISAGTSPAPTKLVVKDLVVGTGATATTSSTVNVKYVGAAYTTGKDFTSQTWTAGKATSFPLSGVVPGFRQGIVGMKVGGRREIVIPPSLGYGATGQGSTIEPNETLVFVVDLEGVS